MKLNFSTLFDSNFLVYGLAMYQSLCEHCPDFNLYVFAFDDKCANKLNALALERMTVISLKEFENENLLRIKPTRDRREYCWTCASSTILYVLEKYKLDHCTYIDADIYFFSDPSSLIYEIGNNSVLITDHYYTPKYDQTAASGRYCVQFITFKNNEQGLNILKWWVNACIKWCFARTEEGKFGDQKYLDDWITRFTGVQVVSRRGAGVAPWNIQQYDLLNKNGALSIKHDNSEESVIFYHYEDIKIKNRVIDFTQQYSSIYDTAKIEYYDWFYLKFAQVLENISNKYLDNSIKIIYPKGNVNTFILVKKILIFIKPFRDKFNMLMHR